MYYLYAYDTVESGIKQLNWIENTFEMAAGHSECVFKQVGKVNPLQPDKYTDEP